MDIKYIAEGETELTFIQQLQSMKIILVGRRKKFNLMQARLKQTNDILTQTCSKIYCVVDTDIADNINILNLQYNIKALSKISKSVIVLAQWRSFEDELRYMTGSNNLYDVFHQKFNSLADLKRFLNQSVDYVRYRNVIRFEKYCNRTNKLMELAEQNGILFPKGVKFECSFIKP